VRRGENKDFYSLFFNFFEKRKEILKEEHCLTPLTPSGARA